MKKHHFVLMTGFMILAGAGSALAQAPADPRQPIERAVSHLEKARAALTEQEIRRDPQVQLAYDELTKALEAVRDARADQIAGSPQTGRLSADPFGPMDDPFAGSPFGSAFGGPMGGGSMAMGGDPFEEIRRMRAAADEAMRRMFEDRQSLSMGANPWQPSAAASAPDTDIQEEDDQFIVRMDLPGVAKDDIKVEARETHLQISGTRTEAREESSERDGFLRRERRVGSFARTVPLPAPIDPARMEASYENGVLVISAPKKATKQDDAQIIIVK